MEGLRIRSLHTKVKDEEALAYTQLCCHDLADKSLTADTVPTTTER